MSNISKTINPFINNLVVEYVQYVKSIKHGQVEDAFDVEKTRHIRVYTSPKLREFLFQELSMYARDMLSAIQHFTNAEYRYTIITYDKMQELYGKEKLSKRRYDDTIRELVRLSIIDYKDREANQYWFNPIYFAPKSRIKLYPECAVKVETVYLRGSNE